ncbi:MAG: hypothetical protein U0694_22850 [Anaerolineae bacterium]
MSISSGWDNDEKTVLLSVYPRQWEWNEEYRSVAVINTLVESVSHEVAVINDLTETIQLPPAAFMHLRALLVNRHPRICCTVLVGMRPGVREMWMAFEELYRPSLRYKTYMSACSVDEARSLLSRMVVPAKKG